MSSQNKKSNHNNNNNNNNNNNKNKPENDKSKIISNSEFKKRLIFEKGISNVVQLLKRCFRKISDLGKGRKPSVSKVEEHVIHALYELTPGQFNRLAEIVTGISNDLAPRSIRVIGRDLVLFERQRTNHRHLFICNLLLVLHQIKYNEELSTEIKIFPAIFNGKANVNKLTGQRPTIPPTYSHSNRSSRGSKKKQKRKSITSPNARIISSSERITITPDRKFKSKVVKYQQGDKIKTRIEQMNYTTSEGLSLMTSTSSISAQSLVGSTKRNNNNNNNSNNNNNNNNVTSPFARRLFRRDSIEQPSNIPIINLVDDDDDDDDDEDDDDKDNETNNFESEEEDLNPQ